jgi:phosphopantetheine adenylyltransferase
MIYNRPELTDDDKKKAEADAMRLVKKYGFNNLPKMLAALCIENVRLTKEINEHRAARGIDPLETFEV